MTDEYTHLISTSPKSFYQTNVETRVNMFAIVRIMAFIAGIFNIIFGDIFSGALLILMTFE